MPKLSTSPKRLTHQTRRRVIIEHAVSFFAERGFAASTRDLASRIGITQPLLFQHFPTKRVLIQAVFDAGFERVSARDWDGLLENTKLDLRSRLIEFFYAWSNTVFDYEWTRIFMFAGLEGGSFNRLFISKLTEPLIRKVAAQIRDDFGLKRCTAEDVSSAEIRLVWILHGGLHYSAVRTQIYGMPAIPDGELRTLIEHGVDSILAGMKMLLGAKRRSRSRSAEVVA